MIGGVDISDYQAAIPRGQGFVIVKATEGLTWNGTKFLPWWAQLEGKLRGAYHFGHPNNDPLAEARHFVRVVKPVLKPGDVVVLDHEAVEGPPAHAASWARLWLRFVADALGRRPMVYTYLSFAQQGRCAGLGGYPLWIADPSRPAGLPRVPEPWSTWTMHQYSTAGGIDRDIFNGDTARWHEVFGPAPAPREDDDMPYGNLDLGQGAITPIALPRGRYKTIGFIADNGLQSLPPATIRVAVHRGKGAWDTSTVKVDSHAGQTVITFKDAKLTDGISVRREDIGDVRIAWEVS